MLGEPTVARLAILSCAMVYGTNFALVKTLDDEMAPSLSASLRFGLAAAASLPILLTHTRSLQQSRLLAGAAEVGVVNALGYVCQAIGLERVDASISAFVCSLVVVVVPTLDTIVLRRRTTPGTWAGCCLAALGVALLSLDPASVEANRPPVTTVAAVATGLQPLFFGYGFWRTEQLLAPADAPTCNETTSTEVATSLACAAAQLAAVKAASDIWLLTDIADGALAGSLDEIAAHVTKPPVVAAVLWTGLVTTFATVLVETIALSKISARETSLLFTTEPLWGAAFASATLHEHLGASASFGGFLIVLACLLSVLGNDPSGTADDSLLLEVLADRGSTGDFL